MAEQEAQREPPEAKPMRPSIGIDLKKVAERIDNSIHMVWRLVIKTAAVVALVLTVLITRHYILSQRIVATLGQTVDAQWAQTIDANAIRPGWLNLEQGYAQIRFARGAQLLAEGPCTLRLDGPNRLFLDSGSISVLVPAEAVGVCCHHSVIFCQGFRNGVWPGCRCLSGHGTPCLRGRGGDPLST